MQGKFKKGIKKHGMSVLFSLPFLALFLVFTVILGLSFTKYDVIQPPQFVGLKNYLTLFLKDDVFITAVKNTILFACIYAPLSMIGCMGIAWIINDYSPLVRTILTFVFYAPSISGGMITIWQIIFSGDAYGVINSILMNLGLETAPVQWLNNPNYIFSVMVIVSVWGCLGTGFLAFVAAFRGIDVSLYEAAAMDGVKNRVQELWYITLPSLRPQLSFTALTSITGAFGVGAVSKQLFGNPSTNYAAHTIALHMEDYATARMDQGVACVMAIILFVLMVGSNNLFRKFINRIGR